MSEEPLIAKSLRDGSTFEQLEASYGIGAKRHGEFPNLVMLKYNQLNSPMAERIVQQCRGLILDESADWRVASYPYDKFFNHGEGNAAAIDWGTAAVYEKLDGSLMTLYHYGGSWRVASSGMPDAAGPAHDCGESFAELFWKTWNALSYKLPENDTSFCFMFELMTPHNRIIIPHAKSRIVLHGVRGLTSFKEDRPEPYAASYGWECVKRFPLSSFDDCMKAAESMRAMECEGYVVCDGNFNRVKIKCPQYVALAHMKAEFSPKRMLEVVRTNESAEFLTYFPEMRPLYEGVKSRYESLCSDVDADYHRLKSIAEQKAFAMEALKTRCSSALFSIRGGKAKDAREYFAGATLPALERAMPDLPSVESTLLAQTET